MRASPRSAPVGQPGTSWRLMVTSAAAEFPAAAVKWPRQSVAAVWLARASRTRTVLDAQRRPGCRRQFQELDARAAGTTAIPTTAHIKRSAAASVTSATERVRAQGPRCWRSRRTSFMYSIAARAACACRCTTVGASGRGPAAKALSSSAVNRRRRCDVMAAGTVAALGVSGRRGVGAPATDAGRASAASHAAAFGVANSVAAAEAVPASSRGVTVPSACALSTTLAVAASSGPTVLGSAAPGGGADVAVATSSDAGTTTPAPSLRSFALTASASRLLVRDVLPGWRLWSAAAAALCAVLRGRTDVQLGGLGRRQPADAVPRFPARVLWPPQRAPGHAWRARVR